jgi:hypothetical protein
MVSIFGFGIASSHYFYFCYTWVFYVFALSKIFNYFAGLCASSFDYFSALSGMCVDLSERDKRFFNRLIHGEEFKDPLCPSAPRSQVALGNALAREVALRTFAAPTLPHCGFSKSLRPALNQGRGRAVQLPMQLRSQVQLGNEQIGTFFGRPISRLAVVLLRQSGDWRSDRQERPRHNIVFTDVACNPLTLTLSPCQGERGPEVSVVSWFPTTPQRRSKVSLRYPHAIIGIVRKHRVGGLGLGVVADALQDASILFGA